MLSRRRRGLCASVLALAVALVGAASTSGASNGQWIVFSARPADAPAAQLFRLQPTGAGLKQITTGGLSALTPSFSPSGTRLAFTRLGSGIFAVNVDGSGLRRLTSNSRDSYPVWSRDGKQIAFLRLYGNQWRVFTMSPTGQGQHRIPEAPPAGRPSWAADDKSILMPSAGELVKIDATSGKVLKYTGLTVDLQTGQTTAVSPDDRMAAFVGPRLSTGPPDCGEGRCQQYALYLGNVSAPHRIRKIANDAGAAGWSPDGKTLVYADQGTVTLRVVSTGKLTRLAIAPVFIDGDAPPAWQPR